MTKGKRKLLRAKRGVSPVISTVILVAVAITVAVAVAFWMGGIAGQYTRFEKLEISSAYATKEAGNFTVAIEVKNTGSTDATLDYLLVNGKPLTDFSPPITWSPTVTTITSGAQSTITVYIDGDLFGSGTTIEITIHSAAGRDYPQMITLP